MYINYCHKHKCGLKYKNHSYFNENIQVIILTRKVERKWKNKKTFEQIFKLMI